MAQDRDRPQQGRPDEDFVGGIDYGDNRTLETAPRDIPGDPDDLGTNPDPSDATGLADLDSSEGADTADMQGHDQANGGDLSMGSTGLGASDRQGATRHSSDRGPGGYSGIADDPGLGGSIGLGDDVGMHVEPGFGVGYDNVSEPGIGPDTGNSEQGAGYRTLADEAQDIALNDEGESV